jgi:hypothetical protein
MTIHDMPPTRCLSPRELARFRRQYRRRPNRLHTLAIVLAAMVSAFGLMVLLGACGGSTPAPAPAAHASPVKTFTVQPLKARISTWYTSGGKAQIAAINTITQQISGDSSSVDGHAMQLDGGQLQEAADAAGHNLPPGNSTLYRKAMSDLSAAGAWFAVGDAATAITPYQRGTVDLSLWADVLKHELGE